jgi:hypothetical protein
LKLMTEVDHHPAINGEMPAGDVSGACPQLMSCPQLTAEQAADHTRERLRRLPPEVGFVLLTVGIAGMILPGPMGTPLALAGGLVLAPRAFDRVERWVQKRFPKIHHHGRHHLNRFIDDFERRFPAKSLAE